MVLTLAATALTSFALIFAMCRSIRRFSARKQQPWRPDSLAAPWQACEEPAALARLRADRHPLGRVELLRHEKRSGLWLRSDPLDGLLVITLGGFGRRGMLGLLQAVILAILLTASVSWLAVHAETPQGLTTRNLMSHGAVIGGSLALGTCLFFDKRRRRGAQIMADDDFLYLRTSDGDEEHVVRCRRDAIQKARAVTAPPSQVYLPMADIAFSSGKSSPLFSELTGHHPGLTDATAELLAARVNSLLTPPAAETPTIARTA